MSTNGKSAGPQPDDHVIVLFGATGDLARRKLLPGLFHLHVAGLLPHEYRVIGSAPKSSALTDEEFRADARDAVTQFGITKPDDPAWPGFEHRLSFGTAEPGNASELQAAVQLAEKEIGCSPRRLFHLAIPPAAFASVAGMLGDSGLAEGATRVIIEKPFGTDLESARVLNRALHAVFDESQVFRIDHFLGKESVDNIVAFRFANGLFEPLWNRGHLRYVQIDVPETLSIEGRAAFYDTTGAYRDMIVTHLFQVMAFVAMEPPVSLTAEHLRDAKEKVFEALRPVDAQHVVRGQYQGYRSEPGVAAESDTETMVAVKAEVDNSRWQGVPFFLRSGKAMGASRQIVTLGVHQPPLRMFRADLPDPAADRVNEIVIDFADPGSISTGFLAKIPGPELALGHATMRFNYKDSFALANALEGYERLILLAMMGASRCSPGRDRAAVGDLHAPSGQPAAGRAVRPRLVGAEVGQQARRAVPLAPAPALAPRSCAGSPGEWTGRRQRPARRRRVPRYPDPAHLDVPRTPSSPENTRSDPEPPIGPAVTSA